MGHRGSSGSSKIQWGDERGDEQEPQGRGQWEEDMEDEKNGEDGRDGVEMSQEI